MVLTHLLPQVQGPKAPGQVALHLVKRAEVEGLLGCAGGLFGSGELRPWDVSVVVEGGYGPSFGLWGGGRIVSTRCGSLRKIERPRCYPRLGGRRRDGEV